MLPKKTIAIKSNPKLPSLNHTPSTVELKYLTQPKNVKTNRASVPKNYMNNTADYQLSNSKSQTQMEASKSMEVPELPQVR